MCFLCSLENLENIRLTQQHLMVISNDLKAHFTLLDRAVHKLFWFQREKVLGEEKKHQVSFFFCSILYILHEPILSRHTYSLPLPPPFFFLLKIAFVGGRKGVKKRT